MSRTDATARVVPVAPDRPRPAARPASPPQLRMVPRRRRATRWLTVLIVGASGAMVGAAWLQTKLAERQQILDRIDRQVREETDRYHNLRLSRAQLLAPEVLLQRAQQLGMTPVRRSAVFQVDVDTLAEVEMAAARPVSTRSEARNGSLRAISAIKAAAQGRP